MAEFVLPAFLENHGPDDLQALGTMIMPDDIDLSEGGHPWNFTRSAALMVAEVCEYIIPEAIKVFVPDYSYSEYLDDHARARAMKRRAATAATGALTITGDEGSIIPAGCIFATSSIGGEPSVEYAAVADAIIPSGGTIEVQVICTQTGIIGNTPAETVIHVSSDVDGISSVTNQKAITGGTEEETDDSLIARIAEYDKSLGDTFVGSPSDYKRWAESVDGAGTANVIPAKDTSGLITIVMTDSNGDPATQALCEAVYDYIMSPDDEGARLATIGASLSVVAPDTIAVAVKAQITLADDATVESVKNEYFTLLKKYLAEAAKDKEIKYSRITSDLASTKGVYDYSGVQFGIITGGTVEYGTSNIVISETQLPTVTKENLHITAV